VIALGVGGAHHAHVVDADHHERGAVVERTARRIDDTQARSAHARSAPRR
jgi:hypothetical protein